MSYDTWLKKDLEDLGPIEDIGIVPIHGFSPYFDSRNEPPPGTLARIIKRIRAILDEEVPAAMEFQVLATTTPDQLEVRFGTAAGPPTRWHCSKCNSMVYSASCPICAVTASGGPVGRQMVIPNPTIIYPDQLRCAGPCGSTIRVLPGLPLGDPWGDRKWVCTYCKNKAFPVTCDHFGIRMDANGDLDEIYCHGCKDVLWESLAAVLMGNAPIVPDCPTCQGPMLLINSTGAYTCQNTQCPNTQVMNVSHQPMGVRVPAKVTANIVFKRDPITPEALARARQEVKELNRPKCTKCGRGLSKTMDAYYGKDPEQEKRCTSCRT